MIPDYQTLMRPILEFLSSGQQIHRSEIVEAMSRHFALSEEEKNAMLSTGRQRKIDSRVGWAVTYLAQAGALNRPRRGYVEIAKPGLQLLAQNQDINGKTLEQFESFRDFQKRALPEDKEGTVEKSGPVAEGKSSTETATPGELVAEAVRISTTALQSEILTAAMALSPRSFESLVLNLLSAMGYGNAGDASLTPSTGDGGVDGIISQDPLGLDRIYVQAKRYSAENKVDRPQVQGFAGALLGKQGDRGVFITTSSFTEGAIREAERISARIELIDGMRLASLLIRHEVGVQVEQRATLYRLDQDYFEDL